MDKTRGFSGLALLGIVIMLLGCGGSTGTSWPSSPPGSTTRMEQLVHPPLPFIIRHVISTTPGVFLYGSQYTTSLPSQNVLANGNALRFTPDWSGSGLSGAAYAIYGFDSSGYTTDNQLHLAWRTHGANPSDVWLGLANFSCHRWDWYASPASGILAYDAYKYTSNNCLYAIVLCLGADLWKLSSISISADVQPVVLAVYPTYCSQGVPTVFTPTIQGTADSYNWDFGGGALPNTSAVCTPEVVPTATGIYSVTLTVTNVFGADVYNYSLQVGKSTLTLSLSNPPAIGSGTATDPYQLDVTTDYTFQLADSDAGDVTLNNNSHYHVSDESAVGSITNLDAILNINDAYSGTFYVTADYPDALHTAHPILYFAVSPQVAEVEIYPDPNDPDWKITTGSGTENDPYILDAYDLTRIYSLLADDKVGAEGNPIPADSLTWKAVPPLIASWVQPGEFRAEQYANGYLYAQKLGSLIINSNRIYIKLY